MAKQILITDTMFIFPEHEEKLKKAGFEIQRLNGPNITEEELVAAIKGKSGYILGGDEKITNKVIDSADKLEAIVFTGADWRNFITAHELATSKGIKIANAPGANTDAVAEYTLALMLSMTRDLFELGKTGSKTFETTNSIFSSSVGIVGLGHIGQKLVEMLKGIGVKDIYYYSFNRKPELESGLGIKYLSFDELLSTCDIISLHTSKETGEGYFGKGQLGKMKNDSLLIDASFNTAINRDDLYNELKNGRIRAALDHAVDERFKELPLSIFFNSNAHTAYNTKQANGLVSDMVTQSIINILNNGMDQYVDNR
jgi:phosphoglycerate dehydrogenase-like enzyme